MPVISKQVEVQLTPTEIASLFCNMNSQQQCQFFNQIAEEVNEWEYNFSIQLQSIVDDTTLTPSGRLIMALIGEFSHIKTEK